MIRERLDKIIELLQTLVDLIGTTEDFTSEDNAVNEAAKQIAEAKDRIPPEQQTTN